MKKRRLAIITSHPIQYNAPLFQELARRESLTIKVFYTLGITAGGPIYDPGFRREIAWDLPLVEGYEFEYVENTSKDKGTHHFNGIINPHLITQVDSFGPDAILIYGWSFKSHLKAMFHYKGRIPVYFRGDSTVLDEHSAFSLKSVIRYLSLRVVYRLVDYAFYVGKSNKTYYLKFGLCNRQLIYAPHVVDNGRFMDTKESYEKSAIAKRHEMGIEENELVFLYVGKFQDVKNLPTLINAFKQVSDDSIRLALIGNGPMEDSLKALSKDDMRIRFLGFQNQSEMPSVYRVGDVFILPSTSETWGLAVNEAMACSKPVLVSQHCGCTADLVQEGKNGFSFHSGDVGQLAEKIKWFADHRDCLPEMGSQSVAIISSFNIAFVADVIENELRSLT